MKERRVEQQQPSCHHESVANSKERSPGTQGLAMNSCLLCFDRCLVGICVEICFDRLNGLPEGHTTLDGA